MLSYTAQNAIVHPDRIDSVTEKHSGDPQSRRVGQICRKCNNGWMSQLQQRAKPVLLPLMQGKPAILSRQAQELIARWIAMSTMTSDFFYPDKHAVPQADRDLLYGTGNGDGAVPQDTWKMWIGRYQRGDWVGRWVHNSIPIYSKDDAPELSAAGIPRPNTQTTTIIFGELYVHVFSCPFPEIVAMVNLRESAHSMVAQIWPFREDVIAWPINPMSDRDADNFAAAIFRMLDAIWRESQGWGPGPI